MKRPKTECPFRVGDVVRSRVNKRIGEGRPMVIEKVMPIPDLREGGYGADVKKVPWWMFCRYAGGAPYISKENVSQYPGAIWVGFMELDPFLGNAKRAVMDASV